MMAQNESENGSETEISSLEDSEKRRLLSALSTEMGVLVRSVGVDDDQDTESLYVEGRRKETHRSIAEVLPRWAEDRCSAAIGSDITRVYLDVDVEAWRAYDEAQSTIREAVKEAVDTGYRGQNVEDMTVTKRSLGSWVVSNFHDPDASSEDIEAELPKDWEVISADLDGAYCTVTLRPP